VEAHGALESHDEAETPSINMGEGRRNFGRWLGTGYEIATFCKKDVHILEGEEKGRRINDSRFYTAAAKSFPILQSKLRMCFG
jgi:hypothetical protein